MQNLQCIVRIGLMENVDVTSTREAAVNTSYDLLKKTNSEDRYSPFLVQLVIWVSDFAYTY